MVPYEDYERHLIDQNSFEVTAAAEVLEFDHQYESRDDFRVRMPDVKFEVCSSLNIFLSHYPHL